MESCSESAGHALGQASQQLALLPGEQQSSERCRAASGAEQRVMQSSERCRAAAGTLHGPAWSRSRRTAPVQHRTPANNAPGRASSSAQQGALLPKCIKFAASSRHGISLFLLVPSDAGQGVFGDLQTEELPLACEEHSASF